MISDKNSGQLLLNFGVKTHMDRDDFMVSNCNKEAFNAIDSWPDWLANGLFIYGPHGCGKTHLAHLFIDKLRSSTRRPYPVSIIEAQSISMKNIERIANENLSVVIENLSVGFDEEALFHLFNIYNQEGRYILWTGLQNPHQLTVLLPDLKSRLSMLPCIEVQKPDDVMLQMLIVKLFNDRQLLITPEILNYIVVNAERSFSYLQKLVEIIDEQSMLYKCAVNYNIVRRAMEIMASQKECEPDLFVSG